MSLDSKHEELKKQIPFPFSLKPSCTCALEAIYDLLWSDKEKKEKKSGSNSVGHVCGLKVCTCDQKNPVSRVKAS